MSWPWASTINSDPETPLNETLGKKTDTASTTSTSSLFSWVKSIYNSATLIITNIASLAGTANIINNSMGVKTLVCPTATTSSSSQPANVNVSSLPSLAQIVGFGVSGGSAVNNIGSVTINGINFAGSGGYLPAFKASDMPSVRETNSATVTSQQSGGGSFVLTIYYRR